MNRYPAPDINDLPEDIKTKVLEVQEKAGFVPNVFLALARRPAEWRAFFAYHDALMLKENDLAAMMGEGETGLGAMSRMVSSVDMEQHAGFTVVEVRSVEQAVTAATAWVTSQSGRGGDEKVVLLLDNMGPEVSSDVGRALSENGLRDHCVLEGSGGVSLDSLGDWAASGVDLVSSSALNRGVAPLDLSMLIVAGGE